MLQGIQSKNGDGHLFTKGARHRFCGYQVPISFRMNPISGNFHCITPTVGVGGLHMIGKTLGHYHITNQLGKGGMGEVFEAKECSQIDIGSEQL